MNLKLTHSKRPFQEITIKSEKLYTLELNEKECRRLKAILEDSVDRSNGSDNSTFEYELLDKLNPGQVIK